MTTTQEPTVAQIIADAGAMPQAIVNRIFVAQEHVRTRHRRRGTGHEYAQLRAVAAREYCELQERSGTASWLDVLEHRLREFGATSDRNAPALVQRLEELCATAIAAIEDIEVGR